MFRWTTHPQGRCDSAGQAQAGTLHFQLHKSSPHPHQTSAEESQNLGTVCIPKDLKVLLIPPLAIGREDQVAASPIQPALEPFLLCCFIRPAAGASPEVPEPLLYPLQESQQRVPLPSSLATLSLPTLHTKPAASLLSKVKFRSRIIQMLKTDLFCTGRKWKASSSHTSLYRSR